MITRSTFYSAAGGDTIQALQTARLLREHGCLAEIRLTNEPINYSDYQLLHFFNITRPADILYHIKKAKLPFVVSTIFINYSEYDKYHRHGIAGMVFKYFSADGIEYIKSLTRWIKGSDRLMSLSFLWKGQRNAISEILKKANLILPNSASEYRRLSAEYDCSTDYRAIPNAVNSKLFRYNRHIPKDSRLVLCVARIEGIKNQLTLIRALNNTKYTLIIIGAAAPNQPSYYDQCKNLAASNIRFIQHLQQEELVAWYQAAKVHVLPSWFETTGLSSLEAAVMGCNIVITDKGDTREYFGDHAVYCDPSSAEEIFQAVERAAAMPTDELLQQKIATHYTWQQASFYTAESYKKVIQKT